MAEFKDRIKELRLEHDYSMGDVVLEINKRYGARLTTSHICRYENGDRTPSITIASYFCKFYGVTADYLLGLTDDKQGHFGTVYSELPGQHRQVKAVTKKKEDNVG